MFYAKKLTTLTLSIFAICGMTAFAQIDVQATKSGTKNAFDPTY